MTQPPRPDSLTQDADDIRSLMNHLGKEHLPYVDIALSETWRAALRRWPLLQAWDTWSQENPHDQ